MSFNKYNISTLFLLPGVEIRPETKKLFSEFGFRNTYLTCKPYSYPFDVIYLLFHPLEFDFEFSAFISNLQRNPYFIEVIDLAGKVVMVYRIPRKFKADYQRFILGQYSKLSIEFKRCFVLEEYRRDSKGNMEKDKAGRPILEPNIFYDVFNMTEKRKDALKERLGYDLNDDILDGVELYEIQDPERESYSLEEYEW